MRPVRDGLVSGARRRLKRGAQGAVALLLLLGAYMGLEQLFGNFHTVVAGELYRSAQINAGDIANLQREYGIRTIVNLRGAAPDRSWYRAEVGQSQSLGIRHVDFGLSAGRELTQGEVEALIALMRELPKPILVHCKGGADRSGIAAALYVSAIAGLGEAAAEWQLSPYYGHVPLPFAPAWAMDETFERIEPWLGFPDS